MQSAPGPDANQQQGYPQPGYPQPGYPQPGYPQPEYTQPGYPPPGYPQPAGYPQPGFQQPVTSPPMATGYQPVQQGNAGWMTAPYGIPNCPPGLEYLTQIDQLLVHQQVELLEAFTGFETNNKYVVKNSLGQKVYFAVEDTDCLTRNCCGPSRPFDMKIMDNAGNEVIHLNRPLRCSSCCFPCCLQTLEVSSPPGTVIGYIEQNWSICYPNFSVKNAAGDIVLQMEGPLCTFAVCGDVEFQVYSADKKANVGKISKQWTGFVKETFTDADNFGINFPADLDVNIKATLLGACFLIDFMFFEKSANQERDRPGML